MSFPRHHKDKLTPLGVANSQYTEISETMVAEALAPLGIRPNRELALAIRKYVELLLRWNQKVSLTSITRPREILERHFGESIFAATAIPIERGCLVDLGSGAGFPGLPIKLFRPSLAAILVESNLKKCAFLSEVCRTLQLEARVVNMRIEALTTDELPEIDWITCRAVRPDRGLLRWAHAMLKPSGRIVFWLGEGDAAAVSTVPHWTWRPAIRIPLSARRVLLCGEPQPK